MYAPLIGSPWFSCDLWRMSMIWSRYDPIFYTFLFQTQSVVHLDANQVHTVFVNNKVRLPGSWHTGLSGSRPHFCPSVQWLISACEGEGGGVITSKPSCDTSLCLYGEREKIWMCCHLLDEAGYCIRAKTDHVYLINYILFTAQRLQLQLKFNIKNIKLKPEWYHFILFWYRYQNLEYSLKLILMRFYLFKNYQATTKCGGFFFFAFAGSQSDGYVVDAISTWTVTLNSTHDDVQGR